MLRPLRLIIGGLLALTAHVVSAQSLDPTFTSPASLYAPGTVAALGPQQADGKRLVAGNFIRVNGAANGSHLLRLDAAGVVDATFAQNVGAANGIYRIQGLANGQYLLGSGYGDVSAGGVTRVEVMRLNADGTGDTSFDPGSGPTTASGFGYGNDYTPLPNGKVLVAGYFDSFNGVAANGIVQLNANGSVDTGFTTGSGVGASDTDYAAGYTSTVQPDGKVLLGGYFDNFNGKEANGLVRLLANGSADPTFSHGLQAGSEVYAIVVQPDGKILVDGFLNTANGFTFLVRLLANGSLDPSFNPAVSTGVPFFSEPGIVLQPDGKVVTTFGSTQVVRLNANGSVDANFNFTAGLGGTVSTLGVQANGAVLVGGTLNYVGDTETPLARLTPSGGVDAGFRPRLQGLGSIGAVLRQPDGQLLLGGTMTEYNGVAVHRLVRVSTSGALDTRFVAASSVLPGAVNSLALQAADGSVVAGTGAGVSRVLASGTLDQSFSTPITSPVAAVAVQPDGRIVVAPSYNSYSTVNVIGVARLTASGALDPTFTRQTTTSIGSPNTTTALLLQADGRIVVGGRFSPSGSTAAVRLVRYLSNGDIDGSFTSPTLTATGLAYTVPYVYALAQQPDGKLLVAGNFSLLNGNTVHSLARLNTTGILDPGFNFTTPVNGFVYSLALQPNGRVLMGGNFAAPTNFLTRVLANGNLDASFTTATAPNSTVRAMLVQPDGGIVLGGSFTTIGGKTAAGVARITAPNVLAVPAPAVQATRLAAWPVPAHDLLHVAVETGAQQVTLLDALGRVVRQQALAGAGEFTVPTEALPAGVYVLRVQYASGIVARQVAVE